MFWKFHLVSSGLDTLLSKEDVTLKEVLDEEDILQECKTQNAKLTEFLAKDEILSELLDLAINVPPENEDEKSQFKYSNLACEVISSSIDAVVDKISTDESLVPSDGTQYPIPQCAMTSEHLDRVWKYLDNPPPLNPLVSSFFSKIVGTMLTKKGADVFDYIKERDIVDKLLTHLEVSAIMEIFIKFMSVLESQELRTRVENWLEDQQLVQKLVKALNPSNSHEMHCNSSNLLSELVRMGRESPTQLGEVDEPARIFLTIEKDEVLSELLDNILTDGDGANSESSLVNGMDVLISLIEFKRPNPEGLEELFTPMNAERIAQGVQSALKAITPRLKDFHKVLVDPPLQSSMLTTTGTLDPPLGKVRLHVAWLISSVVATNTHYVNSELTELGTVNVLLDLFFKYQWNNFLHTYVEHCISSILCNEAQYEGEDVKNPLLAHLICDCCLFSRILDAWEENDLIQLRPGGVRKGYMGHLTRIANNIAHNLEKGPNADLLQSLFTDLPEDIQTNWNKLLEGSLNDLNAKNTTQMQLSSHMLHSSSEDDDDNMFKSTSILQYESSLQQVQQMSNEFMESFGHNEEDLSESSKARNPFDEIGNIDFSINANEETPDAQLFEAVCNEKIHQFDDSGDEEDIWEEKELKFSPKASMKRRTAESNSDESASSSDESSSSDDEAVFADERIQTKPLHNNDVKNQQELEDKMEVDVSESDWTANFDNEGVAMDTMDATAVGWVDPSATSVVEVNDEIGFADFTDLSKLGCSSDDSKDDGSPVAMDEDSNDAFKATSQAQIVTAVEENADVKAESQTTPVEDVKMEDETPVPANTAALPEENLGKGDDKIKKDPDEASEKKLQTETEAIVSSGNSLPSSEIDANQEDKTELENRSESSGNVKVDVVETDEDPLLVTSKVLGSFVVIDSPQSPTSTENKVVLENNDNAAVENPPNNEDKDVANRSGVSVVTISSRKVINISSDGKVDSPSPASPRLVRKSRPKSPKPKKSPDSPKAPVQSTSPNHSTQSTLRTELIMEVAHANGPVGSVNDNQQSNQLANVSDSPNLQDCTSKS